MRIIIAVDNNGFANGMAELERHRTWLNDAEIKVVTVIPSCIAYASMAVVPDLLQEAMTESRKIAHSIVHEVAIKAGAIFPDAHFEEHVLERTPLERLLDLANEWPADIIVVGSHWPSALSRLVLGSVAQALIAKAPCCVLAVRLSGRHDDAERASSELLETSSGQLANTE